MRYEPTVTVAAPRSDHSLAVVRFHGADLSYDQWAEVAKISNEYVRRPSDEAVPQLENRLRAWLHAQVQTEQLRFDYFTKRWVADQPVYEFYDPSQSTLP